MDGAGNRSVALTRLVEPIRGNVDGMSRDLGATTKTSETAEVEDYLARLDHPMKQVLATIRETVLAASPDVGEEIKWNAPTFFFTGLLPHFVPKEYRRVLVVTNLFRQDKVRLVFWQGGRVEQHGGLLTGDYSDGRRLAELSSVAEVEAAAESIKSIIRQQIEAILG